MNPEAIYVCGITQPIDTSSVDLSGMEFQFIQPKFAANIINIRRILAVEKYGNQLRLCSYEIDVPWQLISDLYYCLFDRNRPPRLSYRYDGFSGRQQTLSGAVCYKNTRATIIDMQNLFAKYCSSGPYYNYIAPHGYSQAYINGVDFPKPISQEEYDGKLAEIAKNIKQEWAQKIERQWEEWASQNENEELALYIDHAKAEAEKLWHGRHDQYVRSAFLKNQRLIDDEIAKAHADYAYGAKKEYYLRARQYIFATGYHRRLDSAGILKKLNGDVKMYSTDTLGWTNYDYPISPDVRIGLHTNFGYGVASYFQIVLSYKGIAILPYSLYVHYYYANSRDLAKYTRNYRPNRDNWESAFTFVVETANLAAADPDKFVREWVMHEVTAMIDGLKDIATHPISFWLDKMGDKQADSQYLHCSVMDKAARQHYKVYPHEMDVDFRAKKISGALEFLESLKALRSIYSDVDAAIDTIKSLAKGLIPRITVAMDGIQGDISRLEKLMATWALRKKRLSCRMAEYDKEIENNTTNAIKALNRPLRSDREKEIFRVNEREKFIRQNPEYESHLKAISWCDRRSAIITYDINARQTFYDSLKGCLEKICNHPSIAQVEGI